MIVSIFVMRDVNWYTMTSASTPDAINSFAVITVFLASPERAALSKLVSLLFGTRPTCMQKNKENISLLKVSVESTSIVKRVMCPYMSHGHSSLKLVFG